MRAKRDSTAAGTKQSHDGVKERAALGPGPRGGDWRRHSVQLDPRMDRRVERGAISEDDLKGESPTGKRKRHKRVPSLGTPRKHRVRQGRAHSNYLANFGEWAVEGVGHKVLENKRTLEKLSEVGDVLENLSVLWAKATRTERTAFKKAQDDMRMSLGRRPSPSAAFQEILQREVAPKARVQALRVMNARQTTINDVCGGDFTSQLEYALIRDGELRVAVASLMSDLEVCSGGVGEVGTFIGLSCHDAHCIMVETGLSAAAYTALRHLLPRGLLPSIKPVTAAKRAMAPGMESMEGIADSAICTDMVGMLMQDLSVVDQVWADISSPMGQPPQPRTVRPYTRQT